MDPPPQPTTDADHHAEPDKPSGGYMSNMYDSVSSTAQAAYNQMPSMDPLRALLPGHQDSANNEAVGQESGDGTEKKVDQASNLPVQPSVASDASSQSSEVNRPSTERATSSFHFVPHQSAAHGSSASSISRDSSTQGIHCTSPDSPVGPNQSKDPDSASHFSSITSASAKSTKSGQAAPSASEQIKGDALQTDLASTTAPLASVKSASSSGSKETVSASQPSVRAAGDGDHGESNADDDDTDSEGELGKRDKFKKRFGDLTDKVKAKLHK